MAKTVIHPADERGHAKHDWLDAHHSFSFASWYDPARMHYGALRVLNDDIIDGGMGFGQHPHDNMEIITIVLEGKLEHKDNMGHTKQIVPGEVQVMSAGTGVTHSEYNPDPDHKTNLLQIWILPDEDNVPPRYDQRHFAPEERINKLQTLVSPIYGHEPGLNVHQDAWIYRTTLEKGHALPHSLRSPRHGAYIFLIDGKVNVDGQTLNKRDAMGISGAEGFNLMADEDSDVLVIEVPM